MAWNTKRINVSWWQDQIHKGIEFRKKYALEGEWTKWRSYYRGDWDDGTLPLNFFFMLLRAIVPRVYFKNPTVSVSPTKPGLANVIFAMLTERIDNKMVKQMKLKKYFKKMIQKAFLFGTCPGKLGFGSFFEPSPNSGGVLPFSGKGRIEYRAGLIDRMPWFACVDPGNFVVPDQCEDTDDAMWVAEVIERPYEDVMSDRRFRNRSRITPTRVTSSIHGRVSQIESMIRMYEIRDRKWDRVIVIPADGDFVVYDGPDELQTSVGFNYFSLGFNPDDEYFWNVPDSAIIEPQQLEMNEIRTQMMKHRRVTLVKILAEVGAIEISEAQKMLEENASAVVFANIINKVKPIQVGRVPDDLVKSAEYIHSDIRESVGFSRNQMGELTPKSGDTTATEASIVQMASELRVDERRDIVADLLGDIVSATNEVIFKLWQEEDVVDVVGPAGIRLWITYSGEMLKGGGYEVSVDPESSIPENRQVRRMRAKEMYMLLKENPLIDPVKLTQYFLREMHNVQYDDLMRGLPAGAGITYPMNVGQFGQLLGNADRMALPMPTGGTQNATV